MRFYTNVQMVGDNFLVRGYENGKHFATREKFYPTLFVDSKRKTKYKTLDRLPVEPLEPGTVRECREFMKNYNEESRNCISKSPLVAIFPRTVLDKPNLIIKLFHAWWKHS